MSRYIDADEQMTRIKQVYESMGVDTHGIWNKQLAEAFKGSDVETIRMCLHAILGAITQAPSIDLADYVPREFHDKTCEAMAKRHQEEIADMVRVVRCKECKWAEVCSQNVAMRETYDIYEKIDFCSHGEREGE